MSLPNNETSTPRPSLQVEKLGEMAWPIADLAREYPPIWRHQNKKVIASIAGDDRDIPGRIIVTRWKILRPIEELVVTVRARTCANVTLKEGFFKYTPPISTDLSTHWHMNFADPNLFGFGEGPLMAQDELQIAEHPILCSVAKALDHEEKQDPKTGLKRLTREFSHATPVLVQGAPRRCEIDTRGIYGDSFAIASPGKVRRAVEKIEPPTISNIVALAATVCCWREPYTLSQIEKIYLTAYAGFSAIVQQSAGNLATLHTGHWGCGAFGGNKGLMAVIQLLAAGAAGVEQVHYWYGFTVSDQTAVQHGIQVANYLQENARNVEEALRLLQSANYWWGDANENHVPYEPPDNDLLSGRGLKQPRREDV